MVVRPTIRYLKHIMRKVGSPDQISGWKGPVNMPLLRGQGSHKHKDDIYRFLVIDRSPTFKCVQSYIFFCFAMVLFYK